MLVLRAFALPFLGKVEICKWVVVSESLMPPVLGRELGRVQGRWMMLLAGAEANMACLRLMGFVSWIALAIALLEMRTLEVLGCDWVVGLKYVVD